jgi:plasmid stabilization system protein ParE
VAPEALRVVVTDTAERHIETIEEWWATNRPDAPLLFVEEVEAAFARIASTPRSGAPYRRTTVGAEVRRVLLRRTRHHVYYTCEGGRAVIRAVWHAARGRGPRLT